MGLNKWKQILARKGLMETLTGLKSKGWSWYAKLETYVSFSPQKNIKSY